MQSMAAGVSLDLKWSRQVLELLKAWGEAHFSLDPQSKDCLSCCRLDKRYCEPGVDFFIRMLVAS